LSLADLANLGEFVGGVMVIVSLVYLAINIRQNTLAVRMAAHEHVFATFREIISPVKTDERLAGLLRSAVNFESLPPESQIPIASFYSEVLLHFQNCHVLYRRGALEEETFRAYENYVLSSLANPGVNVWWQHHRHVLAPITVELLDARLRHPSTMPPRIDEVMPWWSSSEKILDHSAPSDSKAMESDVE
jgi:hypothetical protein